MRCFSSFKLTEFCRWAPQHLGLSAPTNGFLVGWFPKPDHPSTQHETGQRAILWKIVFQDPPPSSQEGSMLGGLRLKTPPLLPAGLATSEPLRPAWLFSSRGSILLTRLVDVAVFSCGSTPFSILVDRNALARFPLSLPTGKTTGKGGAWGKQEKQTLLSLPLVQGRSKRPQVLPLAETQSW